MLTGRKNRAKIPVKELVSIILRAGGGNKDLRHFDNLMGNDLIGFFACLFSRAFVLNLKLRRNIFFKTHGGFAIYFLEFRFFGDLFVLSEERVLGLAELFLEYKLAAHEEFTGNNNIEETVFIRVEIGMLVHM